MNTNRMSQIIESLNGPGTKQNTMYTNQEIIERIKSYGKSGNTLTKEQVTKIADTILANHKEQRALCSVKCEEIIADYAKLMVQIEAASNRTAEDISDTETSVPEEVFEANVLKERPWFKRVDWVSVTAGFAAIVIPGVVTTVVTHKH